VLSASPNHFWTGSRVGHVTYLWLSPLVALFRAADVHAFVLVASDPKKLGPLSEFNMLDATLLLSAHGIYQLLFHLSRTTAL
jgi:hypothetical protein